MVYILLWLVQCDSTLYPTVLSVWSPLRKLLKFMLIDSVWPIVSIVCNQLVRKHTLNILRVTHQCLNAPHKRGINEQCVSLSHNSLLMSKIIKISQPELQQSLRKLKFIMKVFNPLWCFEFRYEIFVYYMHIAITQSKHESFLICFSVYQPFHFTVWFHPHSSFSCSVFLMFYFVVGFRNQFLSVCL